MQPFSSEITDSYQACNGWLYVVDSMWVASLPQMLPASDLEPISQPISTQPVLTYQVCHGDNFAHHRRHTLSNSPSAALTRALAHQTAFRSGAAVWQPTAATRHAYGRCSPAFCHPMHRTACPTRRPMPWWCSFTMLPLRWCCHGGTTAASTCNVRCWHDEKYKLFNQSHSVAG